MQPTRQYWLFFFNDTATTEIYTLSLHDALPISQRCLQRQAAGRASETPGPTCDLIRLGQVSHRGNDAEGSCFLEPNGQETSILAAKDAPGGQNEIGRAHV